MADSQPKTFSSCQSAAFQPAFDWSEVDLGRLDDGADGVQHASVAHLSQGILQFLNGDLAWPDDEEDEQPGDTTGNLDDESTADQDTDTAGFGEKRSRKRAVDEEVAARWFPWADRVNFPRTSFSDNEFRVLTWLLAANGVDHVPSISRMKTQQEELRRHFSVETKKYIGALGHTYYVNSLAGIIAQEMANPKVRPNLHFYPEDAGDTLEHAWQGRRWKEKIDPTLLTPMVRLGTQDFFVHEPAHAPTAAANYEPPRTFKILAKDEEDLFCPANG
ncbi:hypothetical protein M407DRAFT_12314 [Tulasnella calospora MUT 4182]|uniref:Uncharacterized protein n=1 Tax=Tulasnella calospora MUT 4182 TaxID=1051891 RepID=A0A0C3K7Y1_9AGAM|nr:hypothetical protein M407DRAFT_12314 [Tulasnella calospora MUT 4182]